MIQRRLYLYIVAAVSLGMLLVGLGNLGTTTLNAVLRAPSTGSVFKRCGRRLWRRHAGWLTGVAHPLDDRPAPGGTAPG